MTNDALTIFLVDDNISDALLIRIALEKIGFLYQLIHFKDGLSALDYLESTMDLPDLIVLDLNLPKYSGQEVLKSVKSSQKLQDLPVIILSTSDYSDDIRSAYQLQAQAYFSKPLDITGYQSIFKEIIRLFPHYHFDDPNRFLRKNKNILPEVLQHD